MIQEFDGRVIQVEFSRSVKKTPAMEARPTPKHNVFVGNLTWRVRSRDLRELFKDSGNVLSAEVIFQANPRRSAGYGFVSFSSKEEAEAAITTLNGQVIKFCIIEFYKMLHRHCSVRNSSMVLHLCKLTMNKKLDLVICSNNLNVLAEMMPAFDHGMYYN